MTKIYWGTTALPFGFTVYNNSHNNTSLKYLTLYYDCLYFLGFESNVPEIKSGFEPWASFLSTYIRVPIKDINEMD
jgi:hypothetical protein